MDIRSLIAGLVWLVLASQAGKTMGAGCGCPLCVRHLSAPDCGYRLVERTIHVPTTVSERRVVNVTECRLESREHIVTVQKLIPETKAVRDVYTVMVPHTESRLETYRVCVPVWREVVQNVTVHIPSQELRQGTRHVCRPVQVQERRTITRDVGHWEDVVVDYCGPCHTGYGHPMHVARSGWFHRSRIGCEGCAGVDACASVGYDAGCAPPVTQQIQRVWKPEIVTEEVPVTVWRNEIIEEPFEYHVTTYRPEIRQQKVKVCEFVTEEKQREVQVAVCVPDRREAVRNVTTYRMVAEPRVQRYTVRVPHTVQKEVDVQVCRMVPKTVVCRIPIPAVPCGGCGSLGCRH